MTAFAHETLSREERFSGPIFTVVTDRVTMSGGTPARRDTVLAKGAVGVVALDDVGRVALIKQYRHAVGTRLWELPAGLRDVAGEEPVLAAARELAEEADLVAARYDLLVDLHTSPGFTDESIQLFLARSLSNGIRRPLSQEDLEAYYAPYPTPASRRPLLQWPREIPIDGQPADVARVVSRNGEWLASSEVPKLLLAFEAPEGLHPSPTGSPQLIAWARGRARALEVVELPAAGHHAAEDRPGDIGEAIVAWMERNGL